MAERGGVQSLERALDILEALAERGELGVNELAATVGLPAGTAHRLLRTLVTRGYAHQTQGRRYALGMRLVPLSRAAGSAVGRLAEPVLAELVASVQESASLAILDGDYAVYIAHVPCARSMRMFTEVGVKADLHTSAVGKALLAGRPDAEIAMFARRRGLAAPTVHSITDIDALLDDIEATRARGYALDQEEHELGVFCVGAPVPGHADLAMSISGPLSRMSESAIAWAVPELRGAADRLSAAIAGTGDLAEGPV